MPSWSGPYGIAFTIHNSLFTIHPSIIRGAIIPFEPITLVLILGAAISGTTEALVGKSAEAGPGVKRRIQRAASLVDAQPLTEVEEAVAEAVACARRDLRRDAIDGLLDADDDTLAI